MLDRRNVGTFSVGRVDIFDVRHLCRDTEKTYASNLLAKGSPRIFDVTSSNVFNEINVKYYILYSMILNILHSVQCNTNPVIISK